MQLQPNDFSSYTLTADEENSGKQLNPLQRAVIQNRLAAIAAAKIAITFDPQNPIAFAQQEAEMQGQILILKQILNEAHEGN